MQSPCLQPESLEQLKKAAEHAPLKRRGSIVLLKGHCPAKDRTFVHTLKALAENPNYTGSGPTERMLVLLLKASGLDPKVTWAINLQFTCTGACFGQEVDHADLAVAASREFDQAVIHTLVTCLKLPVVMVFIGAQVRLSYASY